MKNFFNRHQKIALMFSGGRDSIVCLELLKEHLDKIYVIWCNTGAQFEEIENYMKKVKTQVPNFIEIKTNQPESILLNGYPVDVLPLNYTAFGQACTNKKSIKLRTYFECCNENFWTPVAQKVTELGITGIIRGQRANESHTAPIKSGYVENGIEYFFPIESWTDKQVTEYLFEKGLLNERLTMAHSSLDCWNCTAYLNDSKERMFYIKRHYNDKYKEIVKLLTKIDNVITNELSGMKTLIGASHG